MTLKMQQKTQEKGLTIQQASEKLEVSAHTLRYYERAGLVPPVTRVSGGHRRYQSIDLGWAAFVRKLRRAGLSIGAIRTYAQLQMEGEDTLDRRIEILEGHREAVNSRLTELQETLEYLETKLNYYKKVQLGEAEDCI
jgi:MerR family transcriptional regulator, aldehyde-responsive regulator